jgi:hypothetical protein
VTRDILSVKEEPAMGKRLKKTEKLDLILSELAKLRTEVTKLVRDRTSVAQQSVKARPKPPPRRPKKLPVRTVSVKQPDPEIAVSKPVLPQAPQASHLASRTASQ